MYQPMHFLTFSVVATALLSQGVAAAPTKKSHALRNRSINSTTWAPTAFASSSSLSKNSNFVELKKVKSTSGSKHSAAYLKGLTSTTSSGSTGLISLIEGEEFATTITIGTQTFDVVLDTGSSDTWVVESGFECVNVETEKEESESDCEFGTAYTIDSTFSEISGEEFDIEYGDGEFLEGIFGTETVTIANITVENQTIALATYAGWEGDGTTSGLTGFAYPALTSAYSTKTEQQIVYNPLFTTMYEDGLVDPYFSLAILRDVSGAAGYLTLGGLPPITFNETWATTPILVTTVEGYTEGYDFYTIEVDSINLNGDAVSGGASVKYIVDSGTTLNYYPTSVADAVNAAFDPPATYSDDEGAYIVDCDATPPAHSITIDGITFTIDPLDLILYVDDDLCISGIDDGGDDDSEDVFILGDTFQKNVVSVFDVGAVEMKFAPHENYTSNDTY